MVQKISAPEKVRRLVKWVEDVVQRKDHSLKIEEEVSAELSLPVFNKIFRYFL